MDSKTPRNSKIVGQKKPLKRIKSPQLYRLSYQPKYMISKCFTRFAPLVNNLRVRVVYVLIVLRQGRTYTTIASEWQVTPEHPLS